MIFNKLVLKRFSVFRQKEARAKLHNYIHADESQNLKIMVLLSDN